MARVALLAGGPSSEHDVSLATGAEVLRCLRGGAHEVRPVWISRDARWVFGGTHDDLEAVIGRDGGLHQDDALAALAASGEVAYLALHGPFGEDGRVQRLLEAAGVRYTGSGAATSEMCMDKDLSKLAVAHLGGRCAKHEVLAGTRFPAWGIGKGIGYPCVVKPVGAGSSVGVSLVRDEQALRDAVTRAQAEDPSGRCMVEEFVDGREVTCGVLRRHGDVATLPLVAIQPANAFYDYDAKYLSDATRYECPASVDTEVADEITRLSRALYVGLELRGVARVDFLVPRAGGRPVFLELNTLPGFTSHSLVPMAARAAGLDPRDVVEAVLADASPPAVGTRP